MCQIPCFDTHHSETLKAHLENDIAMTQMNTFVWSWNMVLSVADLSVSFTRETK